jgi:hypothetical protein
MKAVDGKCEALKTHQELGALLVTSIQEWMQCTEQEPDAQQCTVQPTINTTPTTLTRLVVRQNEIGWKHIMLGRFCKDWSEIQDDYYVATMLNTKGSKHRTDQRWQQVIIVELWAQWCIVWEMRNKDLYGATESTRARAEDRKEVERLLRDIHTTCKNKWSLQCYNYCAKISLPGHFAKSLCSTKIG